MSFQLCLALSGAKDRPALSTGQGPVPAQQSPWRRCKRLSHPTPQAAAVSLAHRLIVGALELPVLRITLDEIGVGRAGDRIALDALRMAESYRSQPVVPE